ncbi:hypothetical protein SCLCIDRAFT_27137 [Scleroderma citrinum Foug A]|uniref:Uncharacterized protein n=1 Tax=Scleroderma citrinum Foug A TaxID=1036808 RepID=A0A0C3DGB8_9AGAM|nr:hypothetical protein SCLCIDRAFT_27137 [Scleroderma citrinum Foug A]
MSKLKSLPSTHEQHKIPLTRPIDRLYYLDLTLPNDDDAELHDYFSIQFHSTFEFHPGVKRILRENGAEDLLIKTPDITVIGVTSHPPSPEVTKTIKTIHDVLLHWTMPNLLCQCFACCWEPISYPPISTSCTANGEGQRSRSTSISSEWEHITSPAISTPHTANGGVQHSCSTSVDVELELALPHQFNSPTPELTQFCASSPSSEEEKQGITLLILLVQSMLMPIVPKEGPPDVGALTSSAFGPFCLP